MRRLLLAALTVGILTGCGAQPAPPPAGATVDPAFNATDAAWLGLMIPMDEQFLRILALAPTNSADPTLQRLAAQLTTSHQAELKQLIALRDRAHLPTENQHEGHNMPGMMTEEEVLALEHQHGTPFDTTLRRELKDHLTQSALITHSAKAAGHEPSLKQLATTIEKTRTTQLTLSPAPR